MHTVSSFRAISNSGELIPVLSGPGTVARPNTPWTYAKIQHVLFDGPFSTPERTLQQHYVTAFLSPVTLEWNCSGQWQKFDFEYGSVGLSPAGPHGCVNGLSKAEIIMLAIEPKLIANISEDLGRGKCELVEQIPLNDPYLFASVLALHEDAQQGNPGGKLYGDQIIASIAAHLLMKYSALKQGQAASGGLSPGTLRTVLDYLHSNYAEDISLEDLASLAYLSTYHFSRLFKRSTGMTPHQYLLHCRIKRATELMRASTRSLKEIARDVGFCDQSHLTRHFKRLLGVSPTEYLRKG